MNRREAEELLPWFVAGSLPPEESAAVQAFIDSGEIAPVELETLALFSETVAETGVDEPAYDPAILTRAMARLASTPQDAPEEPLIVRETTKAAAGSSWLARLLEPLQWANTPPLARVALAAQFALVIGLAVALGSESTTTGSYETVAAQPAQGDFSVRFAPGVSEQQIRDLLLAAEASIVSGPSALGIYTVAVRNGSATDADRLTLRQLLDDSALIHFVQPVPRS